MLAGPGRHHALRDARVTVLRGQVVVQKDGATPWALHLGDRVPRGATLRAAPAVPAPPPPGHDDGEPPSALALELAFQDGSVLRLSTGGHLTLLPDSRTVQLRAGAVVVQTDRMLGGVTVLTPSAACITEGTTYLVRVQTGGGTAVEVYSGVVQVVRPRAAATAAGSGLAGGALPPDAQLLVHGERLWVPRPGALTPSGPLDPHGEPAPSGRTEVPLDLSAALAAEPLLLPAGQLDLAAARGLADQQRRGVLLRYSARLRKEIRWQRHRAPITLPPLFQPEAPDQAPPRVAPRAPGAAGQNPFDSAQMDK